MEETKHVIKLDNNLNVLLDETNQTGEIIKSKEANGDVIIPKFANFDGKQFMIKSIGDYAFEYNHFINSISFPDDSEVCSIGKSVFYHCYIKSFNIPLKLNRFNDFWCENAFELNEVNSFQKNPHFLKTNDSLLLFKDDIQKDQFDIIFFAPRNIARKVVIPDFIKKIWMFAFNLSGVKSLAFSEESSLNEIDPYAFYKCFSLESIASFPKTLSKIGRWSFSFSSNLTCVEFLGDDVTLCMGCFSRCSSLLCVSFPNSTKISICSHVFDRVSSDFSLFTEINTEIVFIDDSKK